MYTYTCKSNTTSHTKVYYSQTFHKLQFRYTANSCCTHHIHKPECCESQQIAGNYTTSVGLFLYLTFSPRVVSMLYRPVHMSINN